MYARILSQVQAEEMRFLRSSRCDTSRQVSSCVIRIPEWRSISPNREISAALVWPCVQYASGKIGETSHAKWKTTHEKAAQMSSMDQVASVHLRPCLVPSLCGVSGTVASFWKPWGISSPPKAADPTTLPRGKGGCENELITSAGGRNTKE